MALGQQAIGEVRTEKSGGAGDEYTHGQNLAPKNLQELVGGVSKEASLAELAPPARAKRG
jgi:hypothetical protein